MADTAQRRRVADFLPPRARRLWRWCMAHRHRLSDWAWTVPVFLLTALFQMNQLIPAVAAPLGDWIWSSSSPSWAPLLYTIGGGFLPSALVCAALLWRRSHPLPLLLTAAAELVLFGNFAPAAFAVYSYAAWFSDRWRLAAWTALYAVVLPVALRMIDGVVPYSLAPRYPPSDLGMAIIIALVFGAPLGFGLWVGTRRELIASLRERAARLEREQHLLAERAASDERTRIAREMHDVVAHRVSLMVLQAGGLEVSASDSRTTRIADTIRTTGREALTELRNVLGVLHDGSGAPTAPQPGLAELDRLVAQWREAGMSVECTGTGNPRSLPPHIQRTAYRVIQEALTNAAKHAPGAAVEVRTDYAPALLTVTVANGPPPRTMPAPPASGHGLAGLAERLSLAGGNLTAGPAPEGGWHLHAVIPVPED